MSGSGPSGRAERPGRGDAARQTRRRADADAPSQRDDGSGGQSGRQGTRGAPRTPWRSPDRSGGRAPGVGGARSAPATPFGDEPLTGAGESPWVRFEQSERNTGSAAPRTRPSLPDLSALLLALESLRSAVPRELSDQLTALLRELLLTVRALIDWYLEVLDRQPVEPRVEEIPID